MKKKKHIRKKKPNTKKTYEKNIRKKTDTNKKKTDTKKKQIRKKNTYKKTTLKQKQQLRKKNKYDKKKHIQKTTLSFVIASGRFRPSSVTIQPTGTGDITLQLTNTQKEESLLMRINKAGIGASTSIPLLNTHSTRWHRRRKKKQI